MGFFCLEQSTRAVSKKYESFDARYRFTRLSAERSAKPKYQASFTTTSVDRFAAPFCVNDIENTGLLGRSNDSYFFEPGLD